MIEDFFEECAFMNKSKVSDGEGGTVTTWVEGSHFMAAVVMKGSDLSLIADALKEKKTYMITVKQSVPLENGDVIKRISDGATFKVKSETDDIKTPKASPLNIAQAEAERWDLTT